MSYDFSVTTRHTHPSGNVYHPNITADQLHQSGTAHATVDGPRPLDSVHMGTAHTVACRSLTTNEQYIRSILMLIGR